MWTGARDNFNKLLVPRRAPDFLEPRIPAASGPIILVANRILQVVVLMIVLGRVERRCLDDFRDDLAFERLGLGEGGLRRFGQPLLFRVVDVRNLPFG